MGCKATKLILKNCHPKLSETKTVRSLALIAAQILFCWKKVLGEILYLQQKRLQQKAGKRKTKMPNVLL
jgi:hypothetical protein